MQAAELRAIGALQAARLSFYDQTAHAYGEFAVDAPVEIVGLLGNVSQRDGATMVHAHATLAGHDGACVGGHVAPGCVVFACELVLQELVGEPLVREFDESHRARTLARPLTHRDARRHAGRAEKERVVSEGGLEPP